MRELEKTKPDKWAGPVHIPTGDVYRFASFGHRRRRLVPTILTSLSTVPTILTSLSTNVTRSFNQFSIKFSPLLPPP
jgi:hypothetical protein